VTPATALRELLARLAASRGTAVYVNQSELAEWPPDLVGELKRQQILAPASPATSAVCPGCERACAMPVDVVPADDGGCGVAAFIVCDRRNDINRVEVPIRAVERWRATGEHLADCISRLLHLESRPHGADSNNRWAIGMLEGRKHKDRLALHAGDCSLTLSVAGHAIALEEVLTFKSQAIRLDRSALLQCVDQPTGKVAAESESAESRYTRLLALVDKWRRKNPRKFLQAAADEEGISVFALRQVIYRKPKAADPMTSMAGVLASPAPKLVKAKR